jgi:hypothetical protein
MNIHGPFEKDRAVFGQGQGILGQKFTKRLATLGAWKHVLIQIHKIAKGTRVHTWINTCRMKRAPKIGTELSRIHAFLLVL